jgi:branched-chain amino acid transport system ATP-binding protein
MSGPVLAAERLHTYYGKSHILHGVGLELYEGEIVTLLGRNGAGKSTTLRSLVGLTPPREGTVRLFGRPTGLPRSASATFPKGGASFPT